MFRNLQMARCISCGNFKSGGAGDASGYIIWAPWAGSMVRTACSFADPVAYRELVICGATTLVVICGIVNVPTRGCVRASVAYALDRVKVDSIVTTNRSEGS